MSARPTVKEFVDNALRRAGLGHSAQHKAYSANRLEAGAIKYGEMQYEVADCAREGAEEGIDGANWTGFEFAKRMAADTLDESCNHLTEASVHFALAYEHLRIYIEARDS